MNRGRRGLLVVLLLSIAVCLARLCQRGEADVYTLTRAYYDQEGNEVRITQGEPSAGLDEPESPELLVNINTADKDTLDRLPGVGPALAQRIIDYREAYGGFIAPEELMEVKGVGESLYRELEPYITI